VNIAIGDVDAARRAVEEAEELLAGSEAPGALRPLVALAWVPVLVHTDQAGRALAELTKAEPYLGSLSRDLQAVVAHVQAELLRLQADDEAALRAFARAAALDPTDSAVLRGVAELQTELGDHDASVETIDAALSHATDVADQCGLLRLRCLTLRRVGRLEAALESGRRAVALDADDAQNWLALGDVYQALDRLGPATNAYRRSWAQSRREQRIAAQAVVGLTRALILADQSRSALDVLNAPEDRDRIARLTRTYGAVSFNQAVAMLRCDDPLGARRALAAAARAEQPAPRAAQLADQLSQRLSRDNSWLGFWFLDERRGLTRRLVGGMLLLLLVLTTVLAVANPAEIGWLSWVSPTGNQRLAPLLVVAALLLLPLLTRLKLGAVEFEQPQPAVPDALELEPTTPDEVIVELATTAVVRATRQLASSAAAQGVTGAGSIDAPAQ
jgi:tetratricopeptide (TPR) repeat protein